MAWGRIIFTSYFIWWRYGGSHYEASVRAQIETVDLTGEDCVQDIVHLDDIGSGNHVKDDDSELQG